MTDTLSKQLEFLAIADKMKLIERQTLSPDNDRRENNAEHSWHFALMAMTLFEHCGIDGVNLDRVIKMAIVHDLVEIYAGDTPAHDIAANQDKEAREQAAADKLFAMLPSEQAAEYRQLWEEFDAMQTPDALYASAVDRLQSFYLNHLSGGAVWVKWKATAERVRTRQLPIKTAIPSLWGFVEDAIQDNVKNGVILP